MISLGAPQVGNEAFNDRLNDLKVKTSRVVVKQDVLLKLSGILFNEGMKQLEVVTGALDCVYTLVGLGVYT